MTSFFREELSGGFRMLESIEKSASWGPPPGNLHEYQTKGITKFAFRKLLILKEAFWLFGPSKDEMAAPEKKSRSKLLHSNAVIYSVKCTQN